MASPTPDTGDWYRLEGGEPFEVVAVDEDDGTVEVQYEDGSVEEFELADWQAWADARQLQASEPPEDWSDSADIEADEGRPREAYEDERGGGSLESGLDDIDLFEPH